MGHKIIKFISYILLFLLFSLPAQVFAIGYEGVRNVSWDEGNAICDAGKLSFDPLTTNRDLQWELTNPTCISFMLGAGATIKGTGFATKTLCNPKNDAGLSTVATIEWPAEDSLEPEEPIITIKTAQGIATRTYRCGKRISEYSSYQTSCAASAGTNTYTCGQSALALSDSINCCAAVALYTSAVGAGISALSVIYGVAQGAYKFAKICGNDWNTWKEIDKNGEEKLGTNRWSNGKYSGSYGKCLNDLFKSETGANQCGIDPNDFIGTRKVKNTVQLGKELKDF